MTHTILAVEDRGLRLLAEGTTITLVVEVHTTTTGNTVAVAVVAAAEAVEAAAAPAAAEGQGVLKGIVLHRPQEGTRMIGTDSMATMEGEVGRAMAIGKDSALSLPSTFTDRKRTQLLSYAPSQTRTRKSGASGLVFVKYENDFLPVWGVVDS